MDSTGPLHSQSKGKVSVMGITPIADAAATERSAAPVFVPALSAARVVEATRGREVASEPDKDLFFFAP